MVVGHGDTRDMMHGLFAIEWELGFLFDGSTSGKGEPDCLKVMGSRFSTCEGTKQAEQLGQTKCKRARVTDDICMISPWIWYVLWSSQPKAAGESDSAPARSSNTWAS